jgi:dihydroorotase-like cyclic amidohydrolase
MLKLVMCSPLLCNAPPLLLLTRAKLLLQPRHPLTSAVTIRGGKIVAVADKLPASPRYPVIDYKYAVISPGVIDVHVHMNEPGREHWEGAHSRQQQQQQQQGINSSSSSTGRFQQQ